MKNFGYTVWACAILRNHAHLVVRRHRDDDLTIWDTFAGWSRDALQRARTIPGDHPLWSDRPYNVFLYDADEVRGRVGYLEENPPKENLPPQTFDFVLPCEVWPRVSSHEPR